MKKILVVALLGLLVSCKDATQAQWNALGKRHIITQYGADGVVINKWTSTGNVSNSESSDGWYFEDVVTKKLVEITGTIKIEVE